MKKSYFKRILAAAAIAVALFMNPTTLRSEEGDALDAYNDAVLEYYEALENDAPFWQLDMLWGGVEDALERMGGYFVY